MSEDRLLISDHSLGDIKTIIRRRIFRNQPSEFPKHLQNAKEKLVNLLQQPILFGQSASVLLMGPRGSGKSLILNKVIDEMRADKATKGSFLNVYLNGLIQCEDKVALKETAYQLSLASQLEDVSMGSFAESMSFLLETLEEGNECSKAVVFVLDEFDQYAQTPGQKLLYGLLEAAQSANTPVAIVGLTCRLDVLELLEKRVKSRFSHQLINLFTHMPFTAYTQAFREILRLCPPSGQSRHHSLWNSHLEGLLKDSRVLKLLRHLYDISSEIRILHNLLAFPIVKLSSEHPLITPDDLEESLKEITMDTKSKILKDVSVLELCLLIAMSHLTENLNGDPFNFEAVYEDFRKFASKSQNIKTFSKPVALKAFDHFLSLQLVIPATGSIKSKATRKDFPIQLVLNPEDIKKAVENYPNCPTEIRQWAKSSLAS